MDSSIGYISILDRGRIIGAFGGNLKVDSELISAGARLNSFSKRSDSLLIL
jgi:hypothetical protein